jgi:hypothetical protein
VSATSFLFLFIRALPKFSWCSERRCSENRCVRWLFKIHRSRESEFGSPTHSDDFIPDKLIWTRQLNVGGKIIYSALSEKNRARGYNPIYSSARCFEDKIVYTFAYIVSANFGRITPNKLSVPKSVYFGLSFLARFKTLDINDGCQFIWFQLFAKSKLWPHIKYIVFRIKKSNYITSTVDLVYIAK